MFIITDSWQLEQRTTVTRPQKKFEISKSGLKGLRLSFEFEFEILNIRVIETILY